MAKLSVKKALCFFMVIILLCFNVPSFAATAQSGQCGDNVTWVLNDGVLTISGTGPMQNWTQAEPSPFFENAEIHTVNIQSGVTGVGAYAFYKCNRLTTVNMADSVETVNESSFRSCSGLSNIVFSSNLKTIGDDAFVGCVVKKLVFPEGLISIGEGAFSGCGAVTVIMPDTVTTLGEYAFELSTVSYLVLSSGLKEIPDSAFWSCEKLYDLYIPEGIETIGPYAFYGSRLLNSVAFPITIKSIGEEAFDYNLSLESFCYAGTEEQWQEVEGNSNIYLDEYTDVIYSFNENRYSYDVLDDGTIEITNCYASGLKLIIPSVIDGYTVSSIGRFAFSDKTIMSVEIPDTVTAINESAFSSNLLETVEIPRSVEFIDGNVFWYNDYLTEIFVDEANKNYCAVDGNLYSADKTELVAYCAGKSDAKFDIPSNVKIIDSYAMASCDNLSDVTIPEGVAVIKKYAFYNGNWQNITIPSTITDIEPFAFNYCNRLLNFYVDDNNQYISDDDGVLIAHSGKCLLQYPSGRTANAYRIPDGIEVIEEGAFFSGGFENLLMPESVKYIAENSRDFNEAFLKNIYYEGSENQFGEIDIERLLYDTIIYNHDMLSANVGTMLVAQEGNKVSCEVKINYALNDYDIFAAFYDNSNALEKIALGHFDANNLEPSIEFETDKNLAGCNAKVYILAQGGLVKPMCKNAQTPVYGIEEVDVVLESSHPISTTEYFEYAYDGECSALKITFSEDTEVHESREYISIYDGYKNEIGTYYGKELSGQTVTVPGGTVYITVFGRRGTYYGFKTQSIKVIK